MPPNDLPASAFLSTFASSNVARSASISAFADAMAASLSNWTWATLVGSAFATLTLSARFVCATLVMVLIESSKAAPSPPCSTSVLMSLFRTPSWADAASIRDSSTV